MQNFTNEIGINIANRNNCYDLQLYINYTFI